MAKKRKSLATSLDEVDRTMHSTFCSAANSLSQLYSQAMSHQKLSFLSGERHGLEKLYQWISKQQGEGLRVTSDDILAYIQGANFGSKIACAMSRCYSELTLAELESYVEEPSMTPRNFHQQHSQATSANPFTNSGPSNVPSGLHADQQPRNYIFSNALSSPVRRSLQNYHISHQNRDSIDSSMDMHADNESTH